MSGYGKFIVRDRVTQTPIDIPKRTRPRLCKVCHKPATWAAVELVVRTLIDRDAHSSRHEGTNSHYYCDKHWEPR